MVYEIEGPASWVRGFDTESKESSEMYGVISAETKNEWQEHRDNRDHNCELDQYLHVYKWSMTFYRVSLQILKSFIGKFQVCTDRHSYLATTNLRCATFADHVEQ